MSVTNEVTFDCLHSSSIQFTVLLQFFSSLVKNLYLKWDKFTLNLSYQDFLLKHESIVIVPIHLNFIVVSRDIKEISWLHHKHSKQTI